MKHFIISSIKKLKKFLRYRLHVTGYKSRGVSLYFAVVIVALLLSMALGMSTVALTQIKMIKGMGDSVIAFYAADSGVEHLLNLDKNCRQTGCAVPPCVAGCNGLSDLFATSTTLSNGSSYKATFSSSAGIVIKGVGTYNTIKRAVEIRR